jgi:uridine kinase
MTLVPSRPQQPSSSSRPCLVLLGGASGSGKSWLAQHYGRPALSLDDFYREIAEDAVHPLPRTAYGEIDWDHPGTWNTQAAVAAVYRLLHEGRVEIPDYSISTSSIVGTHTVSLTDASGMADGPVVAEGVFAAQALPALRAAGIYVLAWYVDVHPLITAVLRFLRDVREHRKPIGFLVRRGYALYRADAQTRRRHLRAGFTPVPKRELKRRLAAGGISCVCAG